MVVRTNSNDRERQQTVQRTGTNSKKSRFVYHERTAEDIRERATQQTGMYDSIFKQFPTYKATVGKNYIRFLPPTWDKPRHYGLDIFVHRNVGPDNASYLCLKMKDEDCPLCEQRAYADKEGDLEDATALKPQKRVVAWIIDRNEESVGPKIYEYSPSMDKDLSALQEDSRTGRVELIDHPDTGYDVEFVREGTTATNTKYIGKQIARRSSPISDDEKQQDEWLDFIEENPVTEVLQFYDYDYINAVLSGKVEQKDEDLDKNDNKERVRTRSLREELDDEITDESRTRTRERVREEDVQEEDEPRRRVQRVRENGEDGKEERVRRQRLHDNREESKVTREESRTRRLSNVKEEKLPNVEEEDDDPPFKEEEDEKDEKESFSKPRISDSTRERLSRLGKK